VPAAAGGSNGPLASSAAATSGFELGMLAEVSTTPAVISRREASAAAPSGAGYELQCRYPDGSSAGSGSGASAAACAVARASSGAGFVSATPAALAAMDGAEFSAISGSTRDRWLPVSTLAVAASPALSVGSGSGSGSGSGGAVRWG